MPALRPSPCRPTPSRRAASVAVAVGAAALLASCAGGATAPSATSPAASSTTTADFPLTVSSCGHEATLEAPPERVVAIKSSAIDTVLVLGAGDRLVGTAFPDGPPPEEYAEAAADLPLLSDRVPSSEVVLEVEPDLVYAGWESNLTAEGAGDRETLHALGVATYVSPSACKDPAHQPDRLTFDLVFEEVLQVGTLLGVPEAAQVLVTDQRQAMSMLAPDDRGLTALWYSSGTDVPYVGGGIGAPQMLMDAVGLENVAAGVQDTWGSFSWEQVAEDDPDVIVLVDSAWNSAQAKRELLASNPATAHLTAVREERYLVVPFAGTEAGVRTVPAALDLSRQLTALDVG